MSMSWEMFLLLTTSIALAYVSSTVLQGRRGAPLKVHLGTVCILIVIAMFIHSWISVSSTSKWVLVHELSGVWLRYIAKGTGGWKIMSISRLFHSLKFRSLLGRKICIQTKHYTAQWCGLMWQKSRAEILSQSALSQSHSQERAAECSASKTQFSLCNYTEQKI
jgi:hypothetical protein